MKSQDVLADDMQLGGPTPLEYLLQQGGFVWIKQGGEIAQ